MVIAVLAFVIAVVLAFGWTVIAASLHVGLVIWFLGIVASAIVALTIVGAIDEGRRS